MRRLLVGMISSAIVGPGLLAAAALAHQIASRSAWDGVYTDEQQLRGEAVYSRECSTCHGETLKGGEGSPALTGSDFAASYDGRTVADLFDKIRLTMPAPPEQPGKLTAEQNADVVAHILKVNGFPGSDVELSTDPEQLKQIRITTRR
jgi:mono/diheme cytochrome c family protein